MRCAGLSVLMLAPLAVLASLAVALLWLWARLAAGWQRAVRGVRGGVEGLGAEGRGEQKAA